ncbi:unnamed protein product [Cuscuta campestris]|uniref:Small ribosomal subunit protein uS10c n=2 Tax=Cuscuta sect. Cleistogrammica TaxID=1824901 RepID=A0A484M1Q2_9ASTE|nr:hypothetical protein DM860_000483 [Cuscuta australis]VFQ82507.1 unnamed protein product [Cuscuta campestris]
MAISSSFLFPICNSYAISAQPKLSFLPVPSNSAKFHRLKPSSQLLTSRALAAPEVLDASSDAADFEEREVSFESDKVAPKQKIRIKLKSYWVPLIEDSCKQIMDVARTTNAKTMGPVPLPTKRRVYCVLKSPHVHKDARFHFEIRTHQRLIDILYPTARTIDSLMQLDLPAGVDVEVKL